MGAAKFEYRVPPEDSYSSSLGTRGNSVLGDL